MTYREAIQQAAASIHRRDAELLLAHVLERDRAYLTAWPDVALADIQQIAFENLVSRRAAGEPLQYLTSRQEFYGLDFHVSPFVLIPRPETEHLVEAIELWATRFQDERTLQIADIGTGSGAIAVALATHLAGVQLVATDISSEALTIARQNATKHLCADRIRFLEGDLLRPLATELADGFRFDAIASNPPYIPASDAATMQREVVAHEPHTALFAGPDGLDIYRRLIPAAHHALRSGGLLALEIGFGQRDAIADLLTGWNDIRFIDDYQGIPRIALAERA